MRRMITLVALMVVASACGGGDGLTSEERQRFCEIEREMAVMSQINPFDATPEENEANIRLQIDLFEETITLAPSDLTAEAELVLESAQALLPVFEAAGFDFNQVDSDAFDAVIETYEPGLTEATAAIDTWAAENCTSQGSGLGS